MTRLQRQLCRVLECHLKGDKVPPPEGSAPIWGAFLALSRARTSGPRGPNPISFPEIEAYTRLMRMPLEPHHVDAICAMDALWMERAYRATNAPLGVKTLPPASAQKLTPAVFDLVAG